MNDVVKNAAQVQAEEAFDGFMLWMKRGTLYSCLFLGIVVYDVTTDNR